MSKERAREIRIQTARELESRGFAEKAIAEYVKAGAPGEAARLMVAHGRYLDAGKLMLETLGVSPDEAGRLEGGARTAATKAAQCFELGDDMATATRIRASLGIVALAPSASSASMVAIHANTPPAPVRVSMPPDMLPHGPVESIPPAARSSAPAPRSSSSSTPAATPKRASDQKWGRAAGWRGGSGDTTAHEEMIRQLLEQGKKSAAARVAWDMGRLEDASRWFAECGQDYECGAVLHQMQRFPEAVSTLLRVPAEHKMYRLACAKVLDAAVRIGRFDFEVDRAFTQFSKAPPVEQSEIATYLSLAELYTTAGFHDGARYVLEQVLLFESSHEAARAALNALPPLAPRTSDRSPARRSRIPPSNTPRNLPPLPDLETFTREAKQRGATPTARS